MTALLDRPRAPSVPTRPITVREFRVMTDGGLFDEDVVLHGGEVFRRGRDAELIPYHFNRDQYHRMIPLGVLREGEPTELLNGKLVPRMSVGLKHAHAVEVLNRRLQKLLPDEYSLRVQSPVVIDESEPEPDLTVTVPPAVRNGNHPTADQVFLIVEVADTSLAKDRGEKLSAYAAAGVAEYWVVSLMDRVVEVYTRPVRADDSRYENRTDYHVGRAVPVAIDGHRIGEIEVSKLFVS